MESERKCAKETELCPKYAVNELKFWISQQDLVPELADDILVKFLHSCYYNVNDTKNTLTSYFTIRIKNSQLFLNRTIECVKKTSDVMYYLKMPELTEQGYEVIVSGFFSDDSTDFNVADCFKVYITAVETWTFTAKENSEGIVILADVANFTFSHLKKIEFNVVKAGFQYIQDALPVRLKKIILINVSSPVFVLLSMLQSVIAKRLVHLIEKHYSGSTKYYEIVPRKVLPMEYGGDYPSVKDLIGNTIQQIYEHKESLEKEEEQLRELIAKQPQHTNRSIFSIFSR